MKCSSCGANTWLSHGAGGAVLCKKCADNDGSRPVVYFQETPDKPDETSVMPEAPSVKPEAPPVKPEEASVQFEETAVQPDETSVKPEERAVNSAKTSDKSEEASVIFEDTAIQPDEASVKSEESAVNSVQLQGGYKTSVWIAKLVSFIGWIICCIALFMTFVTLIDAIRSGVLSLDPGLGLLADRVLDGVKSGLILFGPGLGLFSAGLVLIVVGQAGRALFDNANCSRQLLELMKKKSSL